MDDAEFILNLRLDEELNQFISKVDDDIKKQKKWLKKYKKREAQEKEYYFIIESKSGKQYGTVRLYDFKDESFC